MELARIVAMVTIIIGHFLLTYGLWGGSDFISHADITSLQSTSIYVILYSFCVVGVNVFILISGFFTIHLTWKSFLSYYLLCVFYNALVFFVDYFVFDLFSWKALIKVFLVDKTVNWFFRAYFWLMLLAPLLNKAIEALSVREMRIVVGLLFFLNCFSGFLLQEYNQNGYNVYNFIFLYVLGGWLRKDTWIQIVSKRKAISAYVGFCLLNAVIAILVLAKTNETIRQVFAYNNPLIILASIGLFLVFARLDFSNKSVNLVASTVVATLFIQHLYYMLTPVINLTITPASAFLLITPLLFIIAFVVEWPRKKVANAFIGFVLNLKKK